jgi:DNA anti-recombination protein RmuC
MFLKITIMAAIVIAGGILFSSEIQAILPNTSTTGVDSLETDVTNLASKSLESAEEKIESSVQQAESKISDIGHQTIQTAENTINSSAKQVETKLTEIKQNSTEYVEENISDKFSFLDPNK